MEKKKTTNKKDTGANLADPKGIVASDAEIVELKSGIAIVAHDVKELVVGTDEQQAYASGIRSKIKELQEKLKTRLNFLIGPANDYVKSMRKIFKSYTGDLDDTDQIIEDKMISYHDQKEEEARKEAERLEKDNQKRLKKGKVPIPAPAVPVQKTVRTEEGQTSFSKKWTYEITDPKQISREFCEPVGKLLQQAVDEGQRNIPGCKVFQKTLSRRT